MVRYDVKGKSNLTDAFGIDGGGEEGLEGEGGKREGKVARWADDLIGWILRVLVERRGRGRQGYFAGSCLSATTGNRIKEIPRALRRQITCTFGDNYRQKFDSSRAAEDRVSPQLISIDQHSMMEETFHDWKRIKLKIERVKFFKVIRFRKFWGKKCTCNLHNSKFDRTNNCFDDRSIWFPIRSTCFPFPLHEYYFWQT